HAGTTAAGATYGHRCFHAIARISARLMTWPTISTASGGAPAAVDISTSVSSLVKSTMTAPTVAAVADRWIRRAAGSHASAKATIASAANIPVLAQSPGIAFSVHSRITTAAAIAPAA